MMGCDLGGVRLVELSLVLGQILFFTHLDPHFAEPGVIKFTASEIVANSSYLSTESFFNDWSKFKLRYLYWDDTLCRLRDYNVL